MVLLIKLFRYSTMFNILVELYKLTTDQARSIINEIGMKINRLPQLLRQQYPEKVNAPNCPSPPCLRMPPYSPAAGFLVQNYVSEGI